MRHENDQNVNEYSGMAEDASPAASASDSESMNRETCNEKLWPFLGGIAIGAAGVIAGGIATALVADALTYGEGGGSDSPDSSEKELLALPEGGRERSR